MKYNIDSNLINVSTSYINPTIIVPIQISYTNGKQLVTRVTGNLSENWKVIADLTTNIQSYSYQTNPHLALFESNYSNENILNLNMEAILTPKAISYLESLRDKYNGNLISLTININIEYLQKEKTKDGEYSIKQYVTSESRSFSISQSDWVSKFSEALGIGKFLLVELKVPTFENIPQIWLELHKRSLEQLGEMERNIKEGNWRSVLVDGRDFFELWLMGQNKEANKEHVNLWKESLTKLGHTDDSYNQLHYIISNCHNYISKFVHPRTQGTKELQSKPTATKEDAYLVYTTALSMFNHIFKRLLEKE